MELSHNPAHNPAMDEETCSALFDAAAELAHQNFEDPTDDHVETIYHRMVINHSWGLGDRGVVTVH